MKISGKFSGELTNVEVNQERFHFRPEDGNEVDFTFPSGKTIRLHFLGESIYVEARGGYKIKTGPLVDNDSFSIKFI